MGVDYSAYALYGIKLNEAHWFMTEEQYGEDIEGNYKVIESYSDYIPKETILVISDKIVNKYGLDIVYDQYSYNWQILGLYFLKDSPQETIDRLQEIERKWKNLLRDLDIPFEGHEARLMYGCYAW